MKMFDGLIWMLLSFTLFVFGSSVTHGCADLEYDPPPENLAQESRSVDQGGTEPILHLPVPDGTSVLCTQGVGEWPSHRESSTKNDLDFDTPNDKTEAVFAPISGTAYVHTEDASKNFGYHVNIDIGNGYYVCVAHLDSVTIKNGAFVVVGQQIGYEGCTGYCSGDHVHIGLHKGKASEMAQKGVSVPARYYVADKTIGSMFGSLASGSFVCGLKNGHRYTSALPSFEPHTPANTNSSSKTPYSGNGQPQANEQSPDPPASSTKDTTDNQSQKSSNEHAWLNDLDLNGAQDTIMLKDNQWLNTNVMGVDAYVYGIGGCFNNILSEYDRVKSSYGYYQINFSKFTKPCNAEITLVSTVGMDGNPPKKNSMDNWYWWQNATFCSTGSSLCHLQKHNTAWEEWLIRVSWDPVNGLVPLGNGFTKNSQLK